MSATELESLILARPWGLGRQRDLHDLADTLLSDESLVPTIRSLARPSLSSLKFGKADAISHRLLLADDAGLSYPEVQAALPTFLDLPEPEEPTVTDDGASVALHTIVAIRDLIEWVADEPLAMGSTGGVLKAEEKILASGLVVADSDISAIVNIAESAGLVRTIDRRLCVTSRGIELLDDLAGIALAACHAVLSTLSGSVREACHSSGRLDTPFLEWLLPVRADHEKAAIARFATEAHLMGLVAGGTTELGHAIADMDRDARTLFDPILPALGQSVYVLDDLSIIAPGPITRSTAEFLGTLSTVETRGLAPKRRIDPALIVRAIASGSTVESLVEQLSVMSLTPVSAAVTSTIDDIARNGRYVVLQGTGTDTAAKASHPELGAMLLTDPRLQRLAPVKVDDLAVLYGASRLRVETALVDNRYTVVTPAPERVVVSPEGPSKLQELAEHLHDVGLGSTHLERALLTAGKSRTTVTLLVETSTGNKTITLEPRHVANGRVRGLDTKADVERTLPISAIIELLAVGE